MARLVATSFPMRLALSRIAWATPCHFLSWSGVILSAAFSVSMRCSTVSGLVLVAAAAAGGLSLSLGWAVAGAREPANSAAPVSDAMANDRARGVNRGWVMNAFLFQRAAHVAAYRGNGPVEEALRRKSSPQQSPGLGLAT